MRIYGLTGGIASGKTEAANRFLAFGIPVINADGVGHSILEPGGAAESPVVSAFGPGILSEGIIDRRKLGGIVFSEPRELERLNAIVQPIIKEEIWQQCALLAQEGYEMVVIDAALLGEHGRIADRIDGLILVLASEAVRCQRLVTRRGLTPEGARKRIQAQTPPESKRPLADWVLQNDGELAPFLQAVDKLIHVLRATLPSPKSHPIS